MTRPPASKHDPVLHVLAGPNGSGKTTLVERVLRPATSLPFVNAEHLIGSRQSFLAETVFSHHSKVDLLRLARQADYRITLHVVLIPVELAVARVRDRVAQGGHDVPEDKIRSRFARLWEHVAEAIGIADDAVVYDNSLARSPFRVIASFMNGKPVGPPDWPAWTPEALRATSGALVRTASQRAKR